MLTYSEFKEIIREQAEKETGCRVVINPVKKLNGLILDGLVIISTDSNMSPTIYLNGYYEKYKECMDVEEDPVSVVWKELYKTYRQHLPRFDFDESDFTDFEKVRGRLRVKLVNYYSNQELLDDLVCIQYLDLAITFYVAVELGKKEMASIAVKKQHMEYWGKTEDELLEIAKENMEDEYEYMTMDQMLKELVSKEIEFEMQDGSPLYVLGNRNRMYGASSVLIDGLLDRIAEECGADDLAIIPCSIHETILFPLTEETDLSVINNMIEEVNRTEVSKEEYLSNHVYTYNVREKKIRY